MSVEKTGPKGYEVQYLLTLWLGLLHEIDEPGKSTLQVEGLEDAELILRVDSEELQFSMQSKYQEGDLDAPVLAEWLAHFGSRQATECLIHRLQNNPQLVALLITKRRCADNTKGFIRPLGEFNPHKQPPLTKDGLSLLCKGLTRIFRAKATKLEEARADVCQNLAETLEQAGLTDMWKRIVIWDQLTEDEVEQRVLRSLERFRIPAITRPTIIGLLLQEIRKGRDSGNDVMPAIRNLLKKHDVKRMQLAQLNLARPEEQILVGILESKKILCLTGRPQSGKSHLACSIAQSMQDRGIDCLRTDDVQQAINFLDPYTLETKLVVLDDPFTFAHDRSKMRYRISQLARKIAGQHRLIITARIEELEGIAHRIGWVVKDAYGSEWYDVTVINREFCFVLWNHLKRTHTVHEKINRIIEEHFKTALETELLQPGQLDHLARNQPSTSDWGAEAVLSLARFNAPMIADQLCSDDETRLLQLVLGMCAAGFNGMSEIEIQFALQKELIGSGMHPDSLGRMISLGQGNVDQDPDRDFPEYEALFRISSEIKTQLRSFERKGYLRFSVDRWQFSHPDYREAFQRRLLLEPPSAQEDVIDLFRRAFESLDSEVGQSACRFLSLWLSQWNPIDRALKEQIIKHANKAAKRSIFPHVRGSLLMILLTESNHQTTEDLLYLAKNVEASMQAILWKGNTPWIHNSSKGWFADYSRKERQISSQELNMAMSSFEGNQPCQNLPNRVADAFNTVFMLRKAGFTPSVAILRTLLKSDQVFIRADAAEVSLQWGIIANEEIRNLIFSDDHPFVKARVVNKLIKGWPGFKSVGNLTEICKSAAKALEGPAVAVICCHSYFNLYTEINEDPDYWSSLDDNDWQILWSYWAKSAVSILRTLAPLHYRIATDEYYATARESASFVSADDFFALSSAWIDWIEEQLKYSFLDDWALSVVDCCFEAKNLSTHQRNQIAKRMLSVDSTDACGMAVRDLMDHWAELSICEIESLLHCLRSSRIDAYWLKSIALTRADVSIEIMPILTSTTDFFSLPATESVNALVPSMRYACMALTMGYVGYCSAFGVAENRRYFWDNILFSVLQNPADSMFQASVCHLLDRIVNRKNSSDLTKLWESVCSAPDADTRGILIRELLSCSIGWGSQRLGVIWRLFLMIKMPAQERQGYIDQLVSCIESLDLKYRGVQELSKLLGEEFFKTEILSRMSNDLVGWRLFKIMSGAVESEDQTLFANALIAFYTSSPPRLVSFHDWFHDMVADWKFDKANELKKVIKDARSKSIEVARHQRDEYDGFRIQLKDWATPHLTDC
ncbi:hypothetical protein WJU23_17270 [Prosthecobacter sp. SYSU 5D2]|uniref:nSTAND3 domain-containing NTPase n=1 Tax=Prosthecobacter sp. SYSU 5D2 TaxID=3134134 RepID=UPI0031FF25E4